MQKVRNFFIVLALMSVTALVSYKVGENKAGMIIDSSGKGVDLSMMWTVKDKLAKTFLEKNKMVDKTMVYGAISGMVASLGDPYTMYLPPDQNKSANEDLAGQFGGVGISLGFKDKNLAVMSPLPKTPAEKAGLLAGDLILKITDKANKVDKETTGISLEEAVNLIRGKVGTEVTLKMYREGKTGTFDVTMVRDNIEVPSIELEWKPSAKGKVAWIKLYKFSDVLFKEWPNIVNQIVDQRTKGDYAGIVLDLRNNPGGFLQASVAVASDFLKEGVVVSQESSDGTKESYSVDKSQGRLVNDKMVVLVNGGSASASEILAGALHDYKRALLVGEKTFGKGTVQQPEDFPDGSGLHVTVARWLLPSGKNIHKIGVDPDVVVVYVPPVVPTGTQQSKGATLSDNQLDKAIETLLKQ